LAIFTLVFGAAKYFGCKLTQEQKKGAGEILRLFLKNGI
jgi:hypothetical protein